MFLFLVIATVLNRKTKNIFNGGVVGTPVCVKTQSSNSSYQNTYGGVVLVHMLVEMLVQMLASNKPQTAELLTVQWRQRKQQPKPVQIVTKTIVNIFLILFVLLLRRITRVLFLFFIFYFVDNLTNSLYPDAAP